MGIEKNCSRVPGTEGPGQNLAMKIAFISSRMVFLLIYPLQVKEDLNSWQFELLKKVVVSRAFGIAGRRIYRRKSDAYLGSPCGSGVSCI